MPNNLTSKQESFAQAVASGMNQSDAYREAYAADKMKPASINVNACKLMSDAKVAQRVAELRAPAAERAQVTLEGHLRDLMTLRDLAVEKDQISAAITAEIARGKASGVSVEKTESKAVTFSEIRRTIVDAQVTVYLPQKDPLPE